GYLINRSRGKFTFRAHGVECLVHGLNVLGLVSENTGSGSCHRGLPTCGPPSYRIVVPGPQMCDRREELKTAKRPPRPFEVLAAATFPPSCGWPGCSPKLALLPRQSGCGAAGGVASARRTRTPWPTRWAWRRTPKFPSMLIAREMAGCEVARLSAAF